MWDVFKSRIAVCFQSGPSSSIPCLRWLTSTLERLGRTLSNSSKKLPKSFCLTVVVFFKHCGCKVSHGRNHKDKMTFILYMALETHLEERKHFQRKSVTIKKWRKFYSPFESFYNFELFNLHIFWEEVKKRSFGKVAKKIHILNFCDTGQTNFKQKPCKQELIPRNVCSWRFSELRCVLRHLLLGKSVLGIRLYALPFTPFQFWLRFDMTVDG